MYTVRRINIGKSEQLDALALECGKLYSATVVWFWRTVRHQDRWLKPSSMMRWLNSDRLHAHTADATVQAFFASLKSWRVRRKTDPQAKPPRKRKKFFRVEYKNTAIRLRAGKLILSNGLGNEPLIIDWAFECPVNVKIQWTGTEYEAIATYKTGQQDEPRGDKVAGIDLGEIHLAVAHDGENCTILNGRIARSKRRYRNKLQAQMSAKIDTKKKGSRRYKKLVASKRKQLKKLDNQIWDIHHKQTTALVTTLHTAGVRTVAIGDVRDIRRKVDYGPTANQRIHQMPTGKVRFYLTYKLERLGIEVKLQNESYTSQTCPACGHRYKPSGRNYRCAHCGFRGHRDAVGSWNIRAKYLGCGPIVGLMARPTGIGFLANARVARHRAEKPPHF
jgi:putative transposase